MITSHLPNVPAAYGAPMGRPDRGAASGGKLTLRRVRLNSGGYDSGGAYWGRGLPLYWAGTDDGNVDRFFRAKDRDAAKAIMRREFPDARFHR